MEYRNGVAKHLITYLNNFIEISEKEYYEDFVPYSVKREFSRKELILKSGEVENYLNFIVKGALRQYYVKDNVEYTTLIMLENNLECSVESFHGRSPSVVNVEALEPSLLYSISFEKLEKLYMQKPKYERLGRLLLVQVLANRGFWLNELARTSARERFIRFFERSPEVFQRIPQKIIASYLQIKPETFSRFKHLLK